MIAGFLMPVLARRIETALKQQGHRSSGDDAEGFALMLESLTVMAKPVEDDSGQDDRKESLLPETESETLPDVMSPGSVPLSPIREGTAQCEFPQTASMSLPLTGMMVLSARRPGPSEETEPEECPELQYGQFQKSENGERPPVSVNGETRRTFIELMESEPAYQAGKAAIPTLARQEVSAAATEKTLIQAGVEEAEVTPYPSPAIQILAVISAEAPQTGIQTGMPSASHPAHLGSPALPSPSDVKALRLKLQPEELGEVEVTIRRVGLHTKVTITVTGQASADAVNRDKGVLEERLSSLLNPGSGAALSFNIEIRNVNAGQEQNPAASGGHGFSGTALPDGRSPRREERSGSEHQPRLRAGDEGEIEIRDASPASGSDRIV